MAYVSLYRKYRPQTFSAVLGQEHVTKTLARAVEEDRVSHAYLFTGPRGTGKTSTARILAKALNCAQGPTPEPCGKCPSCLAIAEGSSLDVIEMDAASHSKVDETRDILRGVPLATAGGRRKVYVIDEVHMLSAGSFNALLKTLEEPPPHVIFILATTEAHKVLQTIISRTQRFDFRRVPADVIEANLAEIAKAEGIEADSAALAAIARHAEGGVRDAQSMLDQLSSLGGQAGAEDVERMLGERSEDALSDLFDAVAGGHVGAVFQTLHGLISEGVDVRRLALGILGHARSLLLVATSPESQGLLELSEEDRARLVQQAHDFTPGQLLRVLDLIAKATTDMKNAPNHRLLLEVALVRAAAPDTDPSATGLLGRIERLERRMGIETGAEAASAARPPAVRPGTRAGSSVGAEGPITTTAGPDPQGALLVSPPPASESDAKIVAAPETATPEAPVPEPPAPEPPAPEVVRGQEPSAPDIAPGQEPSAPEIAAAPEALPAADAQIAPPVAPPGTADSEHVGLGHIKDAWPATMKEANQLSKRVWGMLTPSRPLRFEGDELIIEVQSAWHESAMNEDKNRRLVAQALHAALGVRPPLRFVERGAEPRPETQEAAHYAEARPVTDATEHDPVELVKKGLGAEVVDERIVGA